MTEEGQEGRDSYKERRRPDFSQVPQAAVSGARIWLMAARPRTLPAAIAPVLVGSAAAVQDAATGFRWGAFVAALIGSIFIQIGTNLANDYSDAKRGADTADRLGPVRVTSAGLIAPRRVLHATWLAFGVAVVAGIYLATVAGWVIIAVGAASIAAGVLYTGGPRPYGYAGMGELFVFLFFGLVAVNGSYYVQLERPRLAAVLALDFGRSAVDGDPRRQQRPRPRDRPPRRQADAGGPARPRAHAAALRRHARRRRVLVVPVGLALSSGPAWALLGLLALPLARRPLEAVMTTPTAPRSTALSRAPAPYSASSASWSAPGC